MQGIAGGRLVAAGSPLFSWSDLDMVQLVLTDEQLRVLAEAGYSLPIVDANGRLVGVASPPPFTDEEIAEAKRRLASDQPRYTTAEVIAKLNALVPMEGDAKWVRIP
jgi:hypothetical protein